MTRRVDGHMARKRFGQNFLTDERVIAGIIAAFAPARGQNVVEIGPGLGALTRELLGHLGRLHVVELDRDLAAKLRLRPELEVIESDVLRVDFGALADAAIRWALQQASARKPTWVRPIYIEAPLQNTLIHTELRPLNGLIDINHAPEPLLAALFDLAEKHKLYILADWIPRELNQLMDDVSKDKAI
mgnify:CR=1 FL=1